MKQHGFLVNVQVLDLSARQGDVSLKKNLWHKDSRLISIHSKNDFQNFNN